MSDSMMITVLDSDNYGLEIQKTISRIWRHMVSISNLNTLRTPEPMPSESQTNFQNSAIAPWLPYSVKDGKICAIESGKDATATVISIIIIS
jgi:hypothetical protein